MEDFRTISNERNDIVFFKKINAGKRIYYIDVKRSKKDELFLSITESKKVFNDEKSEEAVFEKHKLFLYKEEFDKFVNALNESLEYIKEQNKISAVFQERSSLEPEKISLDFNF
ncbi:DNA-binding protein [Bacteroidia bacterium]|nr:DNA-binding protein [Bacteroidia bacterium]